MKQFLLIPIFLLNAFLATAQTCAYNYSLNWQNYSSLSGGWPGGALTYNITETDGNPRSVQSGLTISGNTGILVQAAQSTTFTSSPWVTNFFYQNTSSLTLATELLEMANL